MKPQNERHEKIMRNTTVERRQNILVISIM